MARGLRNNKGELIRHFDGKVYKMEGPYYAPNGITWADLKKYIKELRETGWLVRVEKRKIQPGSMLSTNTHRVFIIKRRKGK
jgi:hypothetical protein